MSLKDAGCLVSPDFLLIIVEHVPAPTSDTAQVLLTLLHIGGDLAVFQHPRSEEHECVGRSRDSLLGLVGHRPGHFGSSSSHFRKKHRGWGDGVILYTVVRKGTRKVEIHRRIILIRKWRRRERRGECGGNKWGSRRRRRCTRTSRQLGSCPVV